MVELVEPVEPVEPAPPGVEPVDPPAPPPAPEPVPTPVREVVAAVVQTAPQLMVFASTGQVAGRSLSRIVGSLTTFEPRWRDTLRLAGGLAQTGGFPLLLLLLAFLFLALQDRIDRNDPKLALAPVHGHQELPFRSLSEGAT